jgi:RimJ/RimL family protein N-acetyltransferase
MARSEIIKTERLLLEPFSEKYLSERYVSWLNDHEIVRYSEQRHRTHTIESCREFMNSFENTPHHFWAVSVVDNNLGHIGNMNTYVDKVNGVADVGILIGDTGAWGQGYATEAWTAICSYQLEKVKIRKVTAGTISPNEAMLKLMKRTGMKDDGCRVKQYIWEGNEVDIIHMALFREECIQK